MYQADRDNILFCCVPHAALFRHGGYEKGGNYNDYKQTYTSMWLAPIIYIVHLPLLKKKKMSLKALSAIGTLISSFAKKNCFTHFNFLAYYTVGNKRKHW